MCTTLLLATHALALILSISLPPRGYFRSFQLQLVMLAPNLSRCHHPVTILRQPLTPTNDTHSYHDGTCLFLFLLLLKLKLQKKRII